MSSLPEQLGGGELAEIPYLRPHPGAAGFRRRAERLAALAPGHSAGDFLAFAGRLAAAQGEVAEQLRLPARTGLPAARPLDVARPPPPEWREALALLSRRLAGVEMPEAARQALRSLETRGAAELDLLAGRFLSGALAAADLGAAVFAGAALQVTYGALAATLPREAVARCPDAGCPVCGFPPVAGLVLPDDKVRYLVCGLCASAWHQTRIQCAVCRTGAGVGYLALCQADGAEGAAGPAKAETCESCRAYTKLLYVEKAPGLEPFADDLATLALDLLVAERGYARNGRSPYLVAAAE